MRLTWVNARSWRWWKAGQSASIAAVIGAAVVGVGSRARPAAAAILPYSENFNGQTTATPIDNAAQPWVQGASGTWSISNPGTVDTTKAYNFSTGATAGTTSTSSFLTNNRPTSGSFIMSTQFVLNTNTVAGTASDNRVGFGLFGADSTFSGTATTGAYYLADVITNVIGGTKDIRVFALGDAAGGSTNVTGTYTGTFGTGSSNVYTLTVTGNYVGSSLTLLAGISGGSGANIVSGNSTTFTDTTPLTGTSFGYRDRATSNNSTSNLNVDHDNFSLTPEPGSLAILGLSGIGLLARRRRSLVRAGA